MDKVNFKEGMKKELASRLNFQRDVKERALAAIREKEKKRSFMMQRVLSAAVLTVLASSLLLFIFSEIDSKEDLLKAKSAANQMAKESYVYRDTDFGFSLELPAYMKNKLRTFDSANGRKFFFHSTSGMSLPLFNIDIYKKGSSDNPSLKGRTLIAETDKYAYFASDIDAGIQSLKGEIAKKELKIAERFAADFPAAVAAIRPAADTEVKYWTKDLADFQEESQAAVDMAWTSLEKEYRAANFEEYFAVTKEQYLAPDGRKSLESAKEKAMAVFHKREKSFVEHQIIDVTPYEINQIEVKMIAEIESTVNDRTPEAIRKKQKEKNEAAKYLATYELRNGEWIKTGWRKFSSE